MLEKHYNSLLKSLPQNYMVTLVQLCQNEILEIRDQIVDVVVSCPTFEDANRKILDLLIGSIKTDQNFMMFCDLLETLVNEDMKAAVHAVRDGKRTILLSDKYNTVKLL